MNQAGLKSSLESGGRGSYFVAVSPIYGLISWDLMNLTISRFISPQFLSLRGASNFSISPGLWDFKVSPQEGECSSFS